MAAEMISFARGAPSADILPAEAVREAADRALREDWQRALSYGTGRGHQGLAEWIGGLHDAALPERIVVTNGSMEAGALVFDQLLEPGDRVVVEQPSYDRTLLLLGQAGVELIPAPLGEDGLEIEAVEEALAAGPLKLVHVIPNFHNPAGCTLSDAKRHRLVELAAEHGFWIFEDDPYRLVRFAGLELPTMLSLDRAGRVIHASSFSKTVSPGVRVGYLVGPGEQMAAIAKRAGDLYISPNMLAQSVVWELCRSGALARNVATVNDALRERRDALVAALGAHLPEARFIPPEGGYFLWVELNDDIDTVSLLETAHREGVGFVPGSNFMLEGGGASIRLAFASVPPEQIDEGVQRLTRALATLRAGLPI